ncbi:MAG: alpha/beta hydrolase [Actinomycetaceae bacterium]|nr:alpha/beta hydrolase [Actinomycetaceae bacterium]
MTPQTWMITKNTRIEGYVWEKPALREGQLPWYPNTRPAILICPGGGYFHVSAREAEPVAMRFYAQGYQVFVLTYSVQDASAYPAPWVEASRAMRFIRFHADKWSIDPEKVAIAGFSAGGHLAAWLSSSFDDQELLSYEREAVLHNSFYEGETSAISEVPNRPDGCLLAYAVTDIKNKALETSDNLTPERIIAELGYMPGKIVMEQRPDCSPIDRVTKAHPPTFIWATAEDSIVPPDQSLRYAVELIRNGVKTEVHIFPEGGHGLSTADHVSCCDQREVPVRTKQWMGLAQDFFDDLFHVN